MTKQFDIVISGKVQGVGFRVSACRKAIALNLKGWVQNLANGSVFACVQGGEESCQAFIEWCRTGPALSRVDKVDVVASSLSDLQDFSVR